MIVSVEHASGVPGPGRGVGRALLGEGQGEDAQTVFGSGHRSRWVKEDGGGASVGRGWVQGRFDI